MSLTQLEYLVALDETRHFAKASRKCFVSQPTLSVQIQKFEQRLGVTLFDRTRHPIVPTLVGEKILAQARKTLQEYAQIREIANTSRSVVEGSYRLGIIPTVAANLVPLFFERFQKEYPKVTLDIEELTTAKIIQALESDEIDGGLAATPLKQEALEEMSLYYENFHIYACKNFGKKKGEKVSSNEIDIKNLLLMKDGHCFRDQVLQLCNRSGSQEKSVRYESGSFDTLMKLVDSGCGMTLIPQLTALSLDKNKRKSRVFEFKNPIPKREISLITKRQLAKASISKAIALTIKDILPAGIEKNKRSGGTVLDPVPE